MAFPALSVKFEQLPSSTLAHLPQMPVLFSLLKPLALHFPQCLNADKSKEMVKATQMSFEGGAS